MNRIGTSLGALREASEPGSGRLQFAWGGVSFAMWSFAIALGVYAFDAAGAAAVGIAGPGACFPGRSRHPSAASWATGTRAGRCCSGSTLATMGILAGAALAVAAGAPTWCVFALAGVYTAVASPYIPAEAALVPQLARTPQELSAANVTHSVMDNLGFLGGSLLTGLLLAVGSVQTAFAAAAAAAAMSLLALATLRPDPRPAYAGEAGVDGVLQQTVAGFRALLSDPPLRLLGACLTLLALVEGAADVLIVIVLLDLLDLPNASVGYVNAAWGVGALVVLLVPPCCCGAGSSWAGSSSGA